VSRVWTSADCARNFLAGVQLGVESLANLESRETSFGPSTGFVYFAAIGDPYITHVKIGFTSKNPVARLRNLQTGCPFKMRLLGFVFGNEGREIDLHDVLENYRCEGEWFAWSEYVERIVRDQLDREAD
jgi:hypothetical protein